MTQVPEKWRELPLAEQMANIGSEVHRMAVFSSRGDTEHLRNAGERALDLIEATITARGGAEKRELTLLKDVVRDAMHGSKEYAISYEMLESYFLPFAIRARS